MKTIAVSVKLGLLITLLLGFLPMANGQEFSPWSEPVNLGLPVNTAANAEFQPYISADELSLYFILLPGTCDPSVGITLWAAHRRTRHDSWGAPAKLPDTVNAYGFNQTGPFLTVDGHFLYFASQRTTPDKNGVTPFGGNDIYVSRRINRNEDFGRFGWQDAENLGSSVNTKYGEAGPFIYEDGETGEITLYFNSNRPGGLGGNDIWAATLQEDGTFGVASSVVQVHSSYDEQAATISHDGLEMYFLSNRPGSVPYPLSGICGPAGQPSSDIWVSTRASTSEPWGPPQNLDVVNQAKGGPAINDPCALGGHPSLSLDGTKLYFAAPYREGNLSIYFDIWITTRQRGNGPNDNAPQN
jgi:hypothetical protein